MKDIFVFSGTTEGRTLAEYFASRGIMVHVRVATEYGAEIMPNGENISVKVGSCGGTEGIAKIIRENMFSIVVDATHPYATVISGHIREACTVTGATYIRISRNSSDIGGDVIETNSIQAAVDYLKDKNGKILATTGAKEAEIYTDLPDFKERVVMRILSTLPSMEKCVSLGFEGRNLICAQGPFFEEYNYAVLKDNNIEWLVTKDSGTVGGFEDKIRAARRAGAKIILIRKPEDNGITFGEAVSLLENKLGLEHKSCPVPEGKRKMCLIGIGMGPGDLTLRAHKKILESDLLIGARRMLESVDTNGKDTLEEYRADKIREYADSHPEYHSISVLLSGDIGFYSGATKLLDEFSDGKYDVDTECGISSAVYLCSKIGSSWQDVRMVSAHGRDCNIVGLSRVHSKLFTLLSGEDTVHDMCRKLFEYGMDVKITVGQCFGYPDEKIVSGTPSELLEEKFGNLCVALIENKNPDTRNPINIRDDEFVRGDAPMTKNEIRTLSVSKLKLCDDSIVYDVGAGTGSVSVEMALCAVNGKVYAIEKEDVAADLIEINKKKFFADNVVVVRGLAPDALADLPAPTHVFIGGSSGNLKEIVSSILEKNPRVRIVINSVTLETIGETMNVIKELNLIEEETTCVNVSWARRLGRYHLMTAQNPIYISVVRGS